MQDVEAIRNLVEQATTLYDAGDTSGALRILQQVSFDAESQNDEAYGSYLNVLGSAQAELGQLRAASQSFNKGLEFYRLRNDATQLGLIEFNLGNVWKYSSQVDAAEEHYRAALDHLHRTNDVGMTVAVHLTLGNMLGDVGDWDGSRKSLAQVIELRPNEAEFDCTLLWSKRSLQMKLAIVDGDDEAAIEFGRQAVEAGASANVPVYEGEALVYLAETLGHLGRTDEARALMLRARDVLQMTSEHSAESLLRRARAGLMKVNNLDLAFGASSSSSKANSTEDTHTNKANISSDKDFVVDARTANFPMMVVQNFGSSNEKLRALVDSLPGRHLCVVVNADALICPVADIAATVFADVADPSTWMALEESCAKSSTGHTALGCIAVHVGQVGVNLKMNGEFGRALQHYAFALRLTTYCGLMYGVRAAAGNLLALHKHVDTHVKHARRGLAEPAGRSIVQSGPLSTQSNTDGPELDALLEFSIGEGKRALESLLDTYHANLTSNVANDRLPLLASLLTLAVLTGTPRRRSWLIEVCDWCEARGKVDEALQSIYNELANADFTSVLAYLGVIDDQTPNAAGREVDSPEMTVLDFQTTWELYLKWRTRSTEIARAPVLTSAMLALDNFDLLRSRAVSGGGANGHRISYDLTQFASRISRDVIRQMINDPEQVLTALELAEATCSRAMVDWMGRTHSNNRLMIRSGVTGSVGEIKCASASEIFAMAGHLDTAILYYFATADGYALWFIHPNGEYFCTHLPGIQRDLLSLFKELPFEVGTTGLKSRAARHISGQSEEQEPEKLNDLLTDFGQQLFPSVVRAHLEAHPVTRVAIVADQVLGLMPFCCIKWKDDEYLVDRFDVVHWPSVTASILCTQADAYYANNIASALDSLVIGAPDFSNPQEIIYRGIRRRINLDDLPGAKEEVVNVGHLLGVAEKTGKDATFAAILDHYYPAENSRGSGHITRGFVPVLHLATHGLTQAWEPLQSFVAMSDKLLTAEFLYTFDPGLRTRLVMLSCCQTAVGYTHPDSVVGLASAFLVAGAIAVGSTLWNVDDEATTTLISRFYEEITRGADVSAAMRTAQNYLRSFPEWSHPAYWAPFRITGSSINPLLGAPDPPPTP